MKAFPTNVKKSSGGDGWQTDYGMDLRDYFAAKAMPALMSAEIEASKFFKDDRPWEWFDIDMDNDSLRDLAQRSYDLADAMMKARKR
jgi:hypothetical protein